MKEQFLSVRFRSLHMMLIRIGKLHSKYAGRDFERLQLSRGQPKILDYLFEHDGCIQREIAKHCNIEAATVTSLLGSMEKAGLIERRNNPQDRRVLNVFLTERGKETQQGISEIFYKLDEECLRGFSKEEREELLQYLERIYNNMNREEREDA